MSTSQSVARAAGTVLALTATAAIGYVALRPGPPPAVRPAAAPTTGITCWSRGTGVTIETVGFPQACMDPGKWTGPVEGLPYWPAKPGHHLGRAVCTADDRGTRWTVWSSGDLLAAEDICGGIGGTPPGEAP